MFKTTLVLLLLVTLTFAQFDEAAGGDNDLIGKPCGSVLDCGYGFLYCIDGKCGYKKPGVDCVAEGQPWTGGQSCCPPMANPHTKGQPCKLYDTTACSDDRTCQIRHDGTYKCCTNSGKGFCTKKDQKC